jgi:hypothetical protein
VGDVAPRRRSLIRVHAAARRGALRCQDRL